MMLYKEDFILKDIDGDITQLKFEFLLQFAVEIQCHKSICVTKSTYAPFPIQKFMSDYEIENVLFQSSSVSFQELNAGTSVILTGKYPSSSWTSMTTSLSTKLGGTIAGIPSQPYPLQSSTSDYSILIATYPDSLSSPASVPYWLRLLPCSDQVGLKALVKSSWLYKARHHGWSLSANMRPLRASNDSFHQFSLNITLNSALSAKDSHEIKKLLSDIESQNYTRCSHGTTESFHEEYDEIRAVQLKDIEIERRIFDPRTMDFTVVTRYTNPFAEEEEVSFRVTEPIAQYYDLLLDSCSLRVISDDASKIIKLVDLPAYTLTDSTCTASTEYARGSAEACYPTVSYAMHLRGGETKEIVCPARKKLIVRHHQPTDSSRGFTVPPSVITPLSLLSDNMMNAGSILQTEVFLLTAPIPDLSMPFNVITLMSTLLAFFFGSFLNALLKHHHQSKLKLSTSSPSVVVLSS